jgi:hypothetical protein
MAEFVVTVADNYHYMDRDEWWTFGAFATADEAVAAAKALVDASLSEFYEPGATAEELFAQYTMFGDDPFIAAADSPGVGFSAWDYARVRCAEIVAAGSAALPDRATEPES